MSQSSTLFTLGYSGFTPETFLEALQRAGVEVLIDVRRKPISRKKGFSLKGLQSYLEGQGVEYCHVPDLGMPESLLEERREGIEVGEYLAAFRRYLVTCDSVLDDILQTSQQRRCCLMCLEKAPEVCHRSVIADELKARSNGTLRIQHLSTPHAGDVE
jgi:uncharacterized protein (DUF488 family)